MVHHSHLAPDGRWVLVILMNSFGKLVQCRVVPFDGSGQEQLVGPKDATCTTAHGPRRQMGVRKCESGRSFSHLAQRFPDGSPEQSPPVQQRRSIAMAADGKSFITSVGTD